MDPVRVASMGIGRWAETLADAAQKAGTLRYAGGYARSADRRAAFVKTYGGRAYESYEALLADPAVEGVVITTPHSLHAEHIAAAAAAGKHVFVDKPFTLTVADARRATEACRRAGVVLALGHQRRRDAASRALKHLVDDGALGRVAQVEGNFSAPYGFARTFAPGVWRADRAETPGGPMTNLGIHHVDTYQYLLGPITRVTALSRRVVLDVDIEDTTSILFEFASGALGYLGSSWLHATRTSYLILHGTEGQAWSEADGKRLFVARADRPERQEIALAAVDPLVEQMAEFARCVRAGARPEVGGEDGIRDIAVLEAIVESAESGRTVAVRA